MLKDLRHPDGERAPPHGRRQGGYRLGLRGTLRRHDAAVAHGLQPLDIPRQSIPSLVSTSVDLMEALIPARRNTNVVELLDRIAELTAA